MKLFLYEKIAFIILILVLFAGTVLLHPEKKTPSKSVSLIKVEKTLKEAQRVDINTASAREISSIPGIGKVMAGRIVEYRQLNGFFYAQEDLLKVKGIGEMKLDRIKEYVKL